MGRALLVDAVGRVGASFFWFLQSVSGYARVSYGVLAREGDRQGGVISAGFGFLQRCFAIDLKRELPMQDGPRVRFLCT